VKVVRDDRKVRDDAGETVDPEGVRMQIRRYRRLPEESRSRIHPRKKEEADPAEETDVLTPGSHG
jgi:hypothetical protein